MTTVDLGYEIGTGLPVQIPLRHMVVTGQSQEAGKTTTLEALTDRLRDGAALAFITKRGEGAFADAHEVQPYFRERTDWQFVQSVLEAALGQQMKFEQSWIMRATKGAKTLAGVQANVVTLGSKAKGLSEDVYYRLNEYLDIVVPALACIKFASTVKLKPHLNVVRMDGERFPEQIHGLVMSAMMDFIYRFQANTITIVPEAWEFIPQGKNSPVKDAATALIRKGATLGNYVWLDSQDIAGVDKVLLRQCPVWLLGVQREANEIKRTLANIPAGIKKPKPSEIAVLEIGEFYACWGTHVVRTYVRPRWMAADVAMEIAMGKRERPAAPPAKTMAAPPPTDSKETDVSVEQKLDTLIALMTAQAQPARPVPAPPAEHPRARTPAPKPAAVESARDRQSDTAELPEEVMYQRFKHRLLQEAPSLIRLLVERPDIELKVERKVIDVDLTSARGMIVKLITEGFMDQEVSGSAVHKEMGRRWNYKASSIRVYEQLQALNAMGFVTKESSGFYKAVADVRDRIREN